MCNTLPVRRFKIPKDGVGYKIFAKMDSGRYNTLYFGQHRYERTDNSGWVRWDAQEWNDEDESKENGFCFFLKQEDAQIYAAYVNIRRKLVKEHNENPYDIVVKKIEYEDGLGEFVSISVPKTTMALCRAWKIVKEK